MLADDFLDEQAPSADDFLGDGQTRPVRRGGTLGEVRAAGQTGRGAGGFAEADPRRLDTKPAQNIPLPEGVEPSRAGAGRGVVNPLAAAVSRASDTYANRDEAIGDAVDRIESGTPPEDVFSAFQQMGVSRDEIVARGQQLGGRMFSPQETVPADGRLIAGTQGRDEIRPRDIGVAEDIANTLGRGAEQFKQGIDSAQFLAGGIDAAEMAERMRAGQRRMGAMAPADDTQAGLDRLQQANQTGEWMPVLQAVADPRNWRALGSMVVESAVATGPTMVAGALATALTGVAGGMPITAAASFAQEYAAALRDELEKRGVDASDPVRVAAALQDPDVRAAIDERGRIRGAAVGAFDAISMGAAGAIGRTLARSQAAGTLTRGRMVGGAAGGAAVETGGGMAGEALAQTGVGESKPLDVVVEGLAEAPSGIADVAVSFLTPRPKAGQPTLPPTQARTASIDRFGEMAAAFGLPEKALARAREAASNMPAGDVPAFLAKLADAYNQRGLFAKPLEPQALTELQAAIDGPPEVPEAAPATEATTAQAQAVDNIEATLRAAGALPDEAIPAADLVDEPPETTTAPVAVEGEPINKRWTAFAPESGTLNIPRADMPQIAAEHRGALVNFLNARGIAHEMGEVDPSELKPTQGEFEPRKVASMVESAGEGRAATGRSILVSGDGFILDGHHQWKAALDTGRPLRVVRFDAPIQDLLRLAHQFPSSTVARGPRRQAEGAPDAGVQPELPDAAERVSGAGPDGPGADAGRAGAVGSVAGDAQRPQPADPAQVAGGGERGVPAGREGGADGALTPAAAPAAPAPQPRVIGSYGRTPKAATPIELRPNADGTLTPFDGKYPMLDFETGEPISMLASTTDAQAAEAIRKAKAITDKDKWFGVKPDESNAAPAPSGGSGESSGGGTTPAPGAATNEQRAALRKRIDGVKALLGCLQS